MPIIRGEWAELLAPGLNRVTWARMRERPSQFPRITDVRTSTRAWEDSFEITGFGPLAKKTELAKTLLDEPIKLGGVRFIHDTFALGFAISREMRDDEQFGLMQRLAGELGRSSRITTELYGFDVLNNGFSTAKYVGRDGKALFAVDHPVVGTGGVYSNTQAVAADLSEAALEAAIGSFDNMVDDRGVTMEIKPKILLVSPENRMLAKRLLQSAGMPGTTNNDINPLADEGLELMVVNWLVDKDAWFLLAAGDESNLVFYWRQQPDTDTWDDPNSGAVFHKISQRHSVGFDGWQGSWGSPGA